MATRHKGRPRNSRLEAAARARRKTSRRNHRDPIGTMSRTQIASVPPGQAVSMDVGFGRNGYRLHHRDRGREWYSRQEAWKKIWLGLMEMRCWLDCGRNAECFRSSMNLQDQPLMTASCKPRLWHIGKRQSRTRTVIIFSTRWSKICHLHWPQSQFQQSGSGNTGWFGGWTAQIIWLSN